MVTVELQLQYQLPWQQYHGGSTPKRHKCTKMYQINQDIIIKIKIINDFVRKWIPVTSLAQKLICHSSVTIRRDNLNDIIVAEILVCALFYILSII